ncbi:MAG: hypothetical protein QNL91_11335 [Candidatus Krumholzibacteria bacterium]|nr:hypothetical protein [Candidatus Krumholzibacteria bacterium]
MAPRSRQILTQMTIILVASVAITVLVLLWKHADVLAFLLGDLRPLVLNGVVLVLFALGLGHLYRALRHYARQEAQIETFMARRAEGVTSATVLAEFTEPSLLRERHATIKELFDSGGVVAHRAISAIMRAGESQQRSIPRFVNNVLILTGVFGTVSSLIFALIGATDVLQTAAPGSGMGLLLLGMNTALTTTATAIVCYFFFTYFYHRFTDLQTWVISRLERAALLYMVSDFTFEAEAVNHQAKLLIEDVRELVTGMRDGMAGMADTVARLDETTRARHEQGERLVDGQNLQAAKQDESLAQLAELRRVLVEGFRLERQ